MFISVLVQQNKCQFKAITRKQMLRKNTNTQKQRKKQTNNINRDSDDDDDDDDDDRNNVTLKGEVAVHVSKAYE